MADSLIQVPADSTGKKVDTESLTVGANTVERQRVQIAGAAATAIAPVDATLGLKTDPSDRATRDLGKVDVAALDQYTPTDVDTGAGADNAVPVALRLPAAGGGVTATGDATNGLDVDVTRVQGTVTVSGTVTANAGTGTLNTEPTATKVDDAAFTPATDKVAMVGAEFDDTLPDSVDEGDAGALRMSGNRNLYTQIRDISAERSAAVTAANALKVDGSAVTQPVSGTVTANLAAGVNNIGDVDVLSLPAIPAGGNKIGAVDLDSDATPAAAVPATAQYVAGTDGTNARGLKTDASGELQVDVLTLPALAAGANNIGDVDVLSMPTGASAAQAQGDVANDGADSGNPVKIGARGSLAAPTAVSADGDRVNLLADLVGQLAAVIETERVRVAGAQLTVKQAEINATASGDTSVVALVSGKKIRVLSLVFSCSAAVAVAWKSSTTSTKINAMSFAANGGMAYEPPHGFFCETVAGEALTINLSATANVRGSLAYVEV